MAESTRQQQALAIPGTTISAEDSRVQQLRAWDQVSQTYPALALDEVQSVLADLDRALAPAEPDQVAAALAHTMALWRAPGTAGHVAEFYLEALAEFPTPIVTAALRRVRMSHRYPTPPTPADFRAAALEIAAPLRGAQVRARLALKRLQERQAIEARAREPLERRFAAAGHARPPQPVRERTDGTGVVELDAATVERNLARWAEHGGGA